MRHVLIVCRLTLLLSPGLLVHPQLAVTLEGTLTDAGTSAPLGGSGFVVTAYDSAGQVVQSASPDASGHYQIQPPTPGTYFVKVSQASGYVPELHGNIACIAADCPVTSGTPVVLASGSSATVDFALAREGIFTGTVRRASDGSGIGGLHVHVYNASTSLVNTGTSLSPVTTGLDGTYSVGGLSPGIYFARVSIGSSSPTGGIDFIPELYGGLLCPRHVPVTDCRIASGAPIVVNEGATTSGIDFSLDAGATISGTVVSDGTLAPLANVPVAAFAGTVQVADAAGFGTIGTDGAGQYTIRGLPPGTYRVRTMSRPSPPNNYVNEWYSEVCVGCPGVPAGVAVGSGALVTGINFSLATGGAISGRVTCAPGSVRVAGPQIHAYSASGLLVRTIQVQTDALGCSSSDYLIEGLPTGQYFLLARDVPQDPVNIMLPEGGDLIDELYNDVVCVAADCDVRRGTPVAVTAGSTTSGVDFALARGASIDVFPTPPLSIFDARGVELVSVVRQNIGFPLMQFVGLPAGTYFVKIRDTLQFGIVCPDCPPTSGTPILIPPGTASLNMPLPVPPSQRVSGTVRNVVGNTPLSTIGVELYTDAGRRGGSAVTDLFGNYSISSVVPGTYFLRTVNDRGFVDRLYSDVECASCDVRNGTPITVTSGSDVVGIDITLSAGGVLSGKVDGRYRAWRLVMCRSRSTPQRVCSRAGRPPAPTGSSASPCRGKLSGARGGQPDPRWGVVQRPAMHERCVRSGIRHADRHHEWRDYSRCQLHAGVVHGHDDVTGAARIRRHRAFLSAGAFDERWLGAVCVPGDCRRLAVGADARRCQRRALGDTGCVRPPSLHGRCQRRQRMRHRADIYLGRTGLRVHALAVERDSSRFRWHRRRFDRRRLRLSGGYGRYLVCQRPVEHARPDRADREYEFRSRVPDSHSHDRPARIHGTSSGRRVCAAVWCLGPAVEWRAGQRRDRGGGVGARRSGGRARADLPRCAGHRAGRGRLSGYRGVRAGGAP